MPRSYSTMNMVLTSFLSIARLVGLAQPTATQTTQLFAGNVAKYPVSLTLATSDNLVHGTLVYTRSGIPIRVVGTLSGQSLLMHEFDKKGNITGIYTGNRTAKGFSGTWRSPSTPGKAMPFLLDVDAPATTPSPVKLTDLTGTYAYNFGPKAGSAMLMVQQVEPNKVAVAMQGVTGEPARNQAIIEPTLLRLTGNQAVYTNTEFGKCAIRLTFFNGGACVDYLDGAAECGFGNAATVTGNYVRVDTKVPVFQQLD